ncbi:MAG: restriction endonuclease subunit S [Acetobacter sp.]|nr:restriction endonuclease subunit S [Acetobacter sp.]
MSEFFELVDRLCPEGVEWKALGEAFTRIRGTPITATKMREIANPAGDIRIFAGGKTVIDAFEKDIPKANITTVPAVLVQSRGIVDFVFYEKPFTFKNEMWAYTTNEKITVKFLYYVLKNNVDYFRSLTTKMGAFPQISLKDTETFKIPLPPLEIQHKVVEILDKFDTLTTSLTEGIPAEIEARRKQYHYYRNKLLSFKELAPSPKE